MSDKEIDGLLPTPADEVLDKRVGKIMGTGKIDIFSDPKTAPEVSPELLKQIDADQPDKSAAVAHDTAGFQSSKVTNSLDDKTTDKAVDEIVASESDTVLAVEDAAIVKAGQKAEPAAKSSKLKRIFKNKWLWISFVALLIAVFALPITRYAVLGLVIKRDVAITVTDSKTSTPVSNALVSLHGKTTKTDAYGKATIKAPLGNSRLSVSKQYFKTYSTTFLVVYKSAQTSKVSLIATGRQVPVIVVDLVTSKPLTGVQITVLDTTAKTDQKGQASIVLPSTNVSEKATLSLAGYNTTTVNIQVTDQVVVANTVSLTPQGQIYFLSNLSGKIDVVRSDLDGANRQTILAGTGKEDPNTTSLLASRDWHFVVLKAQRDSDQASLYLIDTTTDKVTNFDSGNSDLNLIGWYGHNFLYDVLRNTIPTYQTAHEALKSYNADTAQLNLLDQNLAEGTAASHAYQGFYNFYILSGTITYNTQWYTVTASPGTSFDLTGKTDTIRGIQLAAQSKKDYQTFAASAVSYIQAALYQPQSLYYSVYDNSGSKITYYAFDGQTVTLSPTLEKTTFNRTYPTYLLSPSGSQTFWTELRDGKNTLFVGDQNAGGSKQIANLSDYAPYGWFSDNYLLVSKNSSQLYIMPVGGLTGVQQPVKITDYYKPAQTYNGYGYGYGGL